MSVEIENFDVMSVPLTGTNLIEASAGTGKTYSIALLVLRILLEMDLPGQQESEQPDASYISIKEILMVTFTKAAVAELEQRVRKFVRAAAGVCNGTDSDDDQINQLVQRAIENKGELEIRNRLQDAVTFLDESSVVTIHSFCQQMLREFAFETRQSFSIELVTDMSEVMLRACNQFWRSQITVMPLDVLELLEGMLTREKLLQVIRSFFNGKPIYDYHPENHYPLDEAFYERTRTAVARLQEAINDKRTQMIEICQDREALVAASNTNRYTRDAFLALVDDPEAFCEVFLAKCRGKKPAGYLQEKFGNLFELATEILGVEAQLRLAAFEALHYIYAAAISFVSPAVTSYKEQHGQLCFDDLIEQLHARICKEDNPELIRSIQKKYKVVFIDEFQDTDRLQYEIFNKAFAEHTVVFYIGDPKQSIYAWRKADIDTYLTAGQQVDHKYGMHVNYRSSDDFIGAMNRFFKPTADFDTFHYGDTPVGIQYQEVTAPKNNKKGQLVHNNETFPVISITEQKNQSLMVEALTSQVALLLNGDYQVRFPEGETKKVTPADIGILVRRNSDAIPIKKRLSRLGIPSIVIGDGKILASTEAKEVLFVLEAILAQTRSMMNKALLTSITGMTMEQVLGQNDVIIVDRFARYKQQWEKQGVYKALFSFIADYGVQAYLMAPETPGGERIISNLYQVIELVYKQQSNRNLSPLELVDWLRRGIEDPSPEGDEFEQRIESDASCVKIITVHKSKGLQFNIVLTSSMDLKAMTGKEEFLEIKNDRGEEEYLPKELVPDEALQAYKRQRVQENRRLIYVTLTRAVYGCYIYTSTANNRKSFAIHDFLESFRQQLPEGIQWLDPVTVPEGYRYHQQMTREDQSKLSVKDVRFDLLHRDWRRLSYTYLAAPSATSHRYEMTSTRDDYDQFVFDGLTRGSVTGNLLHDIFEHVDFERPAFWDSVVTRAVSRFAPHKREFYEPMLVRLIDEVSAARIKTERHEFVLKDTQAEKRVHEFEFDFPVRPFLRSGLLELLGPQQISLNTGAQSWEGMMNGKIDMLFETQGKYFVLDWKSTYLGSHLNNYHAEQLELEMARHNYHLQYLIYTVATVKYLQHQLADFDYDRDFGGVLYFFVRGVRAGSSTGVYWTKPKKDLIDRLMELWQELPDETAF